MEEAEALSTKMGIMVKGGQFKCFGSSQYIRSKFATSYEIELKIEPASPSWVASLKSDLLDSNNAVLTTTEWHSILTTRMPMIRDEVFLME